MTTYTIDWSDPSYVEILRAEGESFPDMEVYATLADAKEVVIAHYAYQRDFAAQQIRSVRALTVKTLAEKV